MSIRQASCVHKIPTITLRNQINNKRRNSPGISSVLKHIGRTVFSQEEENLLKQDSFKLSELYLLRR